LPDDRPALTGGQSGEDIRNPAIRHQELGGMRVEQAQIVKAPRELAF
jgi:hypothetical protein